MPNKKKRDDELKPKYLYIEDYYPLDKKTKKSEEDEENDSSERGVIIIDIL